MDETTKKRLVKEAKEVQPRAYAPYSGFHVGSALLMEDGSIFRGVNVENASYPVTLCAERNAIGAATTAGNRKAIAVAITTDAETPVMPCGVCAQALYELNPDLLVIAEAPDGTRREARMTDVLPMAFQGEGLDRKS